MPALSRGETSSPANTAMVATVCPTPSIAARNTCCRYGHVLHALCSQESALGPGGYGALVINPTGESQCTIPHGPWLCMGRRREFSCPPLAPCDNMSVLPGGWLSISPRLSFEQAWVSSHLQIALSLSCSPDRFPFFRLCVRLFLGLGC